MTTISTSTSEITNSFSYNNWFRAPAKRLIPIIKLNERATYEPWLYIQCSIVVIRLQDLLLKDGITFNKIFYAIKRSGGIHNYLNCKCKVLLSSIMKDTLIRRSTIETYIEAIKVIKPDMFLTPDGETYEFEDKLAYKETERVLSFTKEIYKKCKYSVPIGLVKGANISQIKNHTMSLMNMGINDLVFHTGDFLNRGKNYEVRRARQYSAIIREICPNLLVYGIGPKMFNDKFSFTSGLITQSHYIGAFNGKSFNFGKWRGSKIDKKDLVMKNLVEFNKYLKNQEKQYYYGGLNRWAAEYGEMGLAIEHAITTGQ